MIFHKAPRVVLKHNIYLFVFSKIFNPTKILKYLHEEQYQALIVEQYNVRWYTKIDNVLGLLDRFRQLIKNLTTYYYYW